MTSGEKITKASHSNLAFAFVSLPAQKRRDISNFYAFCRIVDDLADDTKAPLDQRRAALALWRSAVRLPTAGEHSLAPDLRETLNRYSVERSLLDEIIAGMEMDLDGERYETLEDLQRYCYRVAGAVGLVSIAIFGYQNHSAREHAQALGEALQLTNILRDVGEDLRVHNRIYLPRALLQQHGCDEAQLREGKISPGLVALLHSLAGLAEENYRRAEAAIAPEDRQSLRPGLIMSDIYRRVLEKMRRDDFRIFSRRYRLNTVEKLALLLKRTLFIS